MKQIDCVMVSMLASSAVDRGFKLLSGQSKDYEIDICFTIKIQLSVLV